MIVWRLRGNIIRTALCWIVRHNVHSQQHTYMSSSYRSNRLGLSHWDTCTVCRGGCLELYYCNMMEWSGCSGGIQAWSWQPSGYLQCFDTVGLVIWPVKIVPEITYNVLSVTLSLYTTATYICLLFCTHHLIGLVLQWWVVVKVFAYRLTLSRPAVSVVGSLLACHPCQDAAADYNTNCWACASHICGHWSMQ